MDGGNRPRVTYAIEDVRVDNHWIVSLSSFTWVKAPSTEGREYHHCEKLGRRKMLVMGGLMKRKEPACNKLLEVVDMTTLKPAREFAGEKYEVLSIVTELICGKCVYANSAPPKQNSIDKRTVAKEEQL
jgi:hypothetical protein